MNVEMENNSLEKIITTAIQIPGVKVNRDVFLTEMFQKKGAAERERILKLGPVEAGCSREELKRMAQAILDTLLTRWDAVVNTCTVRRLTSEEAPAEPGAWGAVVLSFTLTTPEEI